jgi:phytoene desaturase
MSGAKAPRRRSTDRKQPRVSPHGTTHELPPAVVIGGGVGGLAAAIRLRAAGHPVALFERNDTFGGKLAVRERDGFAFDVGPSLVTLPRLFDDLFRLAGTTLADEVDLVRLDPQFRYSWRDGTVRVMPDAGWDDPQYRRFVDRGARVWRVSERTFLAGPMSSPWSLARRLRSPRDLTSIDPFRTIDRRARATFDDPHLVQWAGRYATYSGSSPFEAPATLACIPAIEHHHGCWYPMGGLGALRDALVRVAERSGVELHRDSDVARVIIDRRRPHGMRGIELTDGHTFLAPIVVANADAEHLYRDLMPDDGRLTSLQRTPRSTSGFVVLAGVRGRTPDLAHHNVWFSDDSRREFGQLARGQLADDPTIYACVSSVTDPTQAPDGDENWFLLVNTPSDVRVDADEYRDLVLRRLAEHGVDLRDRLAFTETITPDDLAARYRSPGGAIYGTSSNGARAAFARPNNRGPRRGLYLVGGSSHPGGGLPLVTLSGRIVADLVADDLARGRFGPFGRRRARRER